MIELLHLGHIAMYYSYFEFVDHPGLIDLIIFLLFSVGSHVANRLQDLIFYGQIVDYAALIDVLIPAVAQCDKLIPIW
jgi:hypothetical protein